MKFKFFCLLFSFIFIFSIFTYRVIDLSIFHHKEYIEEYLAITDQYVEGESAPRGRILDINGNVLVDNIGVKTIYYHKTNNVSLEKELEIAEQLVELTNYEYSFMESRLKDFYLLKYPKEVEKLILDEEKKALEERKISNEEYIKLKKEKITEEMINTLTDLEKYSSYFYYLMNDGYMYSNKILLNDIDEALYGNILEKNLEGIFGGISWARTYLYEDTLKSIIGTISNSLPQEKTDLLSFGYTYTDKVGISGLEEYYEEYLRGKKAIYKIENNHLKLVSEAKRGNDLVLEIDIDMQLELEKIIKEQMEVAKKQANTEYYRESFAIIGEPSTGSIKAVAGIRRLDNGEFQDISINVIKNAYTVGSAVKGATISVGYKTGVIDIGTTVVDSCVKLANIPSKCSWKKLGRINDVKALAQSSNYYQFLIALGVSKNHYTYNMEAQVSEEDFLTYRNTLSSFGLGTTTGIDLPSESIGLLGEKVAIDLLLNLAIGQYDSYTPVGLLQYINTIANDGKRVKLHLMHSIKNDENIIEYTNQVLNTVSLEEKYMKRIQEGLKEVVTSGTGYYYVGENTDASGKTGTSESYIDSDYDGVLDAYVISNTFVEYTPRDNPKYSLVVISPNTKNINGKTNYATPVNRLIVRNINDYLLLRS